MGLIAGAPQTRMMLRILGLQFRFMVRTRHGSFQVLAMSRRRATVLLSCVPFVAGQAAGAADYLAMPGKELYGRFCAACHGIEGHGDGPASTSFKIEVPDLTLMADRQGASFSRDLVERIIDGRHIIGAHGTRNMPVWGEEFPRTEIGNPEAERATRTVIDRITDYIVSIQRSLRAP